MAALQAQPPAVRGSAPADAAGPACAQVSNFIANLTSEYYAFIDFIQTAPSFFTALAADATLINRQINAVRQPGRACPGHAAHAWVVIFLRRCALLPTRPRCSWCHFTAVPGGRMPQCVRCLPCRLACA